MAFPDKINEILKSYKKSPYVQNLLSGLGDNISLEDLETKIAIITKTMFSQRTFWGGKSEFNLKPDKPFIIKKNVELRVNEFLKDYPQPINLASTEYSDALKKVLNILNNMYTAKVANKMVINHDVILFQNSKMINLDFPKTNSTLRDLGRSFAIVDVPISSAEDGKDKIAKVKEAVKDPVAEEVILSTDQNIIGDLINEFAAMVVGRSGKRYQTALNHGVFKWQKDENGQWYGSIENPVMTLQEIESGQHYVLDPDTFSLKEDVDMEAFQKENRYHQQHLCDNEQEIIPRIATIKAKVEISREQRRAIVTDYQVELYTRELEYIYENKQVWLYEYKNDDDIKKDSQSFNAFMIGQGNLKVEDREPALRNAMINEFNTVFRKADNNEELYAGARGFSVNWIKDRENKDTGFGYVTMNVYVVQDEHDKYYILDPVKNELREVNAESVKGKDPEKSGLKPIVQMMLTVHKDANGIIGINKAGYVVSPNDMSLRKELNAPSYESLPDVKIVRIAEAVKKEEVKEVGSSRGSKKEEEIEEVGPSRRPGNV